MLTKITEIMKELDIAPTFTVRDELYLRFDIRMTVDEVRGYMIDNKDNLGLIYYPEPDVFVYEGKRKNERQ